METFQDFLNWYNNKDVVPTLEALQKMMQIYQQKGTDMLKLGFTLRNLGNRILRLSSSHSTRKRFQKLYMRMVDTWSVDSFQKTCKSWKFEKKNSSNTWKTIVGIDAIQLYPFSMMKDMPTGVYTKWELHEDTGLFHPRRSKRNYLECIALKYFQKQDAHCCIQTQSNQKSQKRTGVYLVDGFCSHCNWVFEVLGCYWHFCPFQEKKRLHVDEVEKSAKRWQ